MTRMTTPARPVTKTVLSLSALALLITGGLLFAGPLNPPAGPVTSTYKTLTEVEPRTAINAANTPGDADSLFKITLPGSYYLTGNITGAVGKHGIEIATRDGVAIDLMGFDLVGVPAMGTFDGVSTTVASLTNIAVINGSVRNWGQDGIDLVTFTASGGRVEGVRASGNAQVGVYGGTTIVRCSGAGSQYGIYSGAGATISDCSASNNSVLGITGESGSTLTNCSAYANSGVGISTGVGCTVTNCSATGNTGDGFSTGSGCAISNCSAYNNTSNGIITGDNCTVTNCSATFNTGSGITTGGGGTVTDCSARSNTLDGIRCSSACVIRGNTCSGNGFAAGDGAGIHATVGDNRIEGNTCTGADRGIDVDGAGNIIIKNTCSGNTNNWALNLGTSFGPIVVAGGNAIAILTNGAVPSTLTTTDPHANFSY